MDLSLEQILWGDEGSQIELVIADCTITKLTDKAFERRLEGPRGRIYDSKWDQDHLGIAFKFKDIDSWHSVWASMTDYDEQLGFCKLRSYKDVFLSQLQDGPRHRSKSPRKRIHFQ